MRGLSVLSKLADLANAPQCDSHSHSVFVSTPGGLEGGYYTCKSNNVATRVVFSGSFLLATFWYYLATLAFEVPVLYIFGFRSKKAIGVALLTNLVTVFGFHFASSYCSQSGRCDLTQGLNTGFIIVEALIICIEAAIYTVLLASQIQPRKIVMATLLANLNSAIIGGLIVNGLFGGFH